MFFKVLQKNAFSHKKIKIYERVPKFKNYPHHWSINANEGVPFSVDSHLLSGMLSGTKPQGIYL
jgi:hypothetical protein